MAILNCLDNIFKHIKKYTHFMADLSGIGARVCVVIGGGFTLEYAGGVFAENTA